MLRTRNQFVVSARGGERRHALALVVHVREQDVEHFNGAATGGEDEAKSSDRVEWIEHVLELLDSDADFEAVVRALDAPRAPPDAAKSKSSAAMKTISSPLVHVQWRVIDSQSHHAVPNVLEAMRRPRSECFSRNAVSGAVAKSGNADEVYIGGMFAPVPVRKLTVELWLYPPHVAIPTSGDRVPVTNRCVTDFFLNE